MLSIGMTLIQKIAQMDQKGTFTIKGPFHFKTVSQKIVKIHALQIRIGKCGDNRIDFKHGYKLINQYRFSGADFSG